MSDITFLTQSHGGAIHIVRFEDSKRFDSFVKKHVLRSKNGTITKLELAHINHGDGHEDVLLVPGFRPELHIHGGEANEKALLTLIHEGETLSHHHPDQLTLKQRTEQLWHQTFQKCRGERAQNYLLSILDIGFDLPPDELSFDIEGYEFLKPYRVVFVGPPNTGKSTLFNALLGENKALVSNLSGTTRDLLKANIILDGWEIEIVDTAGLHPDALQKQHISPDHIQGESERLAIQAVHDADLILAFRCQLTEDFVRKDKVIEVHTMCEDGKASSKQLEVSVHQKRGLDQLNQAMLERVRVSKKGTPSKTFCLELKTEA